MFNLHQYQYFEDINLGLLKYRPHNKSILDIGCGSGLLGQMYRENNNIVYGIDSSREVEAICKKRLDKFCLGDITDYRNIARLLRKKKFDIIVFADVLEHLVDPIATGLFYKQFLKKDGLMYISIPNIALWYVRLSLLLGNFDYTETGVLDKTHLRFFTKKNLLVFLDYCGMELVKLDITPGISIVLDPLIRKIFIKKNKTFNRRAILDSRLYQFYTKYIYPLEYLFCKLAPNLLAFKFIAIARNKLK